MRVLWFVNIPFPAVIRRLGLNPGYGGSWMLALAPALLRSGCIRLTIAWSDWRITVPVDFTEDGIRYLCLPEGFATLPLPRRLPARLRPWNEDRAVGWCVEAIRLANPDLVHVFGTEKHYGLVGGKTDVAVVVWMQGLLDVYRHHYWGTVPLLERWCYPRTLLACHDLGRAAARERRILTLNRYFIGRTQWDRAHLSRLNPRGIYFHVQDALRPEFFLRRWTTETAGLRTLYSTTSAAFYKGTDTILEAMELLVARFPDLQLKVAADLPSGSDVARRLRTRCHAVGLDGRVTWLGQLSAAEVAGELERSRVFILPSHIENNPNSLAEALVVGTPSVSSFCGGIPSMVRDGGTGLLFSPGDASCLADHVGTVLLNDTLARSLSEAARSEAVGRYHPEVVAGQQEAVYARILDQVRRGT